MRYVNCIVVVCVLFPFFPMAAVAGNLDSPAAPTDPVSAMYMLEAIYNRLDKGTPGSKRTGAFTEPSSGPTAGTGHTLDDVMGKAPSVDDTNGAGVVDVLAGKTFWGLTSAGWGSSTGSRYGGCTCEGTLYEGRWCHNGDGTVTDLTTCLVWLRRADYGQQYALWVGTPNGTSAHDRAAQLKDGVGGLNDGSVEGDWRLPTKTELVGLVNGTPVLRCSDPGPCNLYAFTGVQSDYYWSSSTSDSSPGDAWHVLMSNGYVYHDNKSFYNYVWPVRGGQ